MVSQIPHNPYQRAISFDRSRESWLFPLLMCSLWYMPNNWMHLKGIFACLHSTLSHYHHYADLSESIEDIKCLSSIFYILSSVYVRLNPLSQLFLMQYMRFCVFYLPMSLLVIVGMFALHLIFVMKSKIWIISQCLGLGREKMVCAVCHAILVDLCRFNPREFTRNVVGYFE